MSATQKRTDKTQRIFSTSPHLWRVVFMQAHQCNASRIKSFSAPGCLNIEKSQVGESHCEISSHKEFSNPKVDQYWHWYRISVFSIKGENVS
jgi:hypothetical protein